MLRILHQVHQIHDGCIFVAIRLFGKRQHGFIRHMILSSLIYMMIGLTHHENRHHVLDVHDVKSFQQFLLWLQRNRFRK